MLAFANVFHFFAHKLASLSAGRFAFALIFSCSFHCFFFWHNKIVSPLERRLDVNKKAAGDISRRSFVSTQPVLSSALLAALLTATLFFLLAPLTFAFLSFAILLPALLSGGRRGFAWFVWILLCVHDVFLIVGFMFGSFALSESTFVNQIAVESDLD